MNMTDGGICAPKGFKASGAYCGIRKSRNKSAVHKNDICIFVSERRCNTAIVYTKNKVKGAPIIVTQNNMAASNNQSVAVIANSKNANTCNIDGIEKADKMCELLSKQLEVDKNQIIVASTGVIGQILPIEPIESAIPGLVEKLDANGNEKAATAIMTTDTFKKEYAVQFEIAGKTCFIGGMGKGSGMIHPDMATTLNFITTDCSISSEMLDCALHEVVDITFNCLSIDGDTSTNDMVSLMANGMAKNPEITTKNKDYETFKSALYQVMANITRLIAKDGEGATKLLESSCIGAPDLQTAIKIAKSVVTSNLFKAAMFGQDANWGRILAAIGCVDANFDINNVNVTLKSRAGQVVVCENGYGSPFDEEEASKVLVQDEIYIIIELNQGEFSAKAWGCDLTYDYVRINGDYRS